MASTAPPDGIPSKADMNVALGNVKVLEFGNAIFSPLCCCLLADFGASVTKVEPLEGDLARLTGGRGDSVLFLGRNRGKRSFCINLRDSRGLDIALKLASDADVLVHNLRPGTMKKIGLDYESVSGTNPRVVYASLYMYGETGPMSRVRGGDAWAQAFTGFVASQGNPGEPPYMAAHSIMDVTGATLAAYGITVALLMRERTGLGQEITTSLVNAGAFLQGDAIGHLLMEGLNLKKGGRGHYRGIFPFGAYPAKDGDVVTIFGQDDDEWRVMCQILGIEYLLEDARYDTVAKRTERKVELYPVLDQVFRQKTRAEWQELFRQHGLRCDPCLDYAELVAHPQFQANDLLIEVKHPRDGLLRMVGAPVKLKGSAPVKNPLPPPILGQHSVEILRELRYTKAEIDRLIQDGVVGVPTPDMMKASATKLGAGDYVVTGLKKPKKQSGPAGGASTPEKTT